MCSKRSSLAKLCTSGPNYTLPPTAATSLTDRPTSAPFFGFSMRAHGVGMAKAAYSHQSSSGAVCPRAGASRTPPRIRTHFDAKARSEATMALSILYT